MLLILMKLNLKWNTLQCYETILKYQMSSIKSQNHSIFKNSLRLFISKLFIKYWSIITIFKKEVTWNHPSRTRDPLNSLIQGRDQAEIKATRVVELWTFSGKIAKFFVTKIVCHQNPGYNPNQVLIIQVILIYYEAVSIQNTLTE